MNKKLSGTLILALGLVAVSAGAGPVYGLKWNQEDIEWHDYEAGIDLVKSTGKPMLVVLFAPWCAACHEYESVFQNHEVVELTRAWVMVRIDVSEKPAIANSFAQDGMYTPRTYVVSLDGNDLPIYSNHPEFKRFFTPNPEVFVQLLSKSHQIQRESH